MNPVPDGGPTPRPPDGRMVRPEIWRPPDRHILLGVSHPSDDPALHRVFEVRAAFDAVAGGWLARVAEQNQNEQREPWGPHLRSEGAPPVFATAAACLGDAVASVVAMADREAVEPTELIPRASSHAEATEPRQAASDS